MLSLALKSLWNRRFVALLTVLSVALSVALIIGVERLRSETRDSFANSASGIDLIVAARDDPVSILMATVFGVGATGTSLDWTSFEMVAELPDVAWAVPISMGDNHRGYPVIGTWTTYFEHFRHSGGEALVFSEGAPFSASDGAVVGAQVAARFGYSPGTVIINAHGSGAFAFDAHDEAPFTIAGTLAPTGTAVDRMIFVSLEGFDRLHAEPEVPPVDPFAATPGADVAPASNEPDIEGVHAEQKMERLEGDGPVLADNDFMYAADQINAIYVGLSHPIAVLGVQRAVSEHTGAPLTAVLPNVALLELWSITGTAERALRLMSWAVAVAGMLGMVTMLSATLEARRREFAILRSVGATPTRIFGLIVTEAAVVTLVGILLGLAFGAGALKLAEPLLAERFGIRIEISLPSSKEFGLLGVLFVAGLLASLVPAVRVYRMTLADGLSIRL